MSEFDMRERKLEEDIEASLLKYGGYVKGDPASFDRDLALDTKTFIEFIKKSQPKEWQKEVRSYGDQAEKKLIERFNREVKTTSLLDVMRKGFTDLGAKFRVVFWKPESTLNATDQEHYAANIFHCTRQLHYSPKNENSIDIVLFINGIPVVTMELKCQFTGQSTDNAIAQYKFDRARKEAIFAFKERALVHFAVDLDKVYMTTRLQGAKTYFLPFNQGSNGAGNVGCAGNPVNPDGYTTAYLWENVLTKDSLLEILHKFLHIEETRNEEGEIVREIMIFPRFHQLDVVRKLLADVKETGSGKNYLIQHSAGSGKSNSIAWLAHRLSGLQNVNNEKIFDSVIIVTDRRVLDSQLRNTVRQFEQITGQVIAADKNAQQLKDALQTGNAIIVTTLQKFPVIYKEVELTRKRFAIIVDEAHSSQTGKAAQKLKRALSDPEALLKEYADEAAELEANCKDNQDIVYELLSQGKHKNMSFFAFTATPKAKTLQLFGTQSSDGKYHPYHIYSMRQAIDEHFILDVLKNYMTYAMYYKIVKTVEDNPNLNPSKAVKAITRYESLHPHNIAQKTTIMLEHFMSHTRGKIGGKAKAMVVTASRLHAVRYVQEFRRQIQDNPDRYGNLKALVAFSGEVEDQGLSFTEVGLNKTPSGEVISEAGLPKAFNSPEYSVLIVAEKYQTGFDEPLLHTMFVDKKLTDVKAVQTLSRLNRTCRGKDDTFVLDFVNTREDIQESFAPFFEETFLEEATDPNVLYDIRNTLGDMQVFESQEVRAFKGIFFSTEQSENDLGKLQGTLKPALDRYMAKNDEEQEIFKGTLARFNRIYDFVTQICRLNDADLHAFSVFAKLLAKSLPKDEQNPVDLDGKILLEYYKLEKTSEGAITLQASDDGQRAITGDTGKGKIKIEPLTEIINKVNERFGTEFTEMDKVLLQLQQDFVKDAKWQGYAKNTTADTFGLLFSKEFDSMAAVRFAQNQEFFKKLFEEPAMLEMVRAGLCAQVYSELRKTEKGI